MDIVERLRAFRPPYGWPEEYSIIQEAPLNEAAVDEITRLRARLEEAEAAKADAWDDGFEIGRCTGHPQINPYRSKNDAN